VARFLALLELYKEGVLLFEQLSALGELHIRWTGSDEGEVAVTDEFDAIYVAEDEEGSNIQDLPGVQMGELKDE